MNLQNAPAMDLIAKAVTAAKPVGAGADGTSRKGEGEGAVPEFAAHVENAASDESVPSTANGIVGEPAMEEAEQETNTVDPEAELSVAAQENDVTPDHSEIFEEPPRPEQENVRADYANDTEKVEPHEKEPDPEGMIRATNKSDTASETLDDAERAEITVDQELANERLPEEQAEAVVPAAAHPVPADIVSNTSSEVEADLVEEKTRLLEQFRNAAELANRRSAVDRGTTSVQSAMETVIEAPAAVIQKLQHSLSSSPLLNKLLGNDNSAEDAMSAKLEPAVQAAVNIVNNLQNNNKVQLQQASTIMDNTSLENVSTGSADDMPNLSAALAEDLDLSATTIFAAADEVRSTGHISFLPTANLHSITQAISALAGRADGGNSVNAPVGAETVVAANPATQNTQRMEIQLVPKSLGVIEIAMQRTDAGVSVQIQAQTADAERLLNSDRQALQEVMRNAGILVDEIKVVANPNLADNFDSSRNNQQSLANFAERSDHSAGSDGFGRQASSDDAPEHSLDGQVSGSPRSDEDVRDGLYL